jgi:hypothetical protein
MRISLVDRHESLVWTSRYGSIYYGMRKRRWRRTFCSSKYYIYCVVRCVGMARQILQCSHKMLWIMKTYCCTEMAFEACSDICRISHTMGTSSCTSNARLGERLWRKSIVEKMEDADNIKAFKVRTIYANTGTEKAMERAFIPQIFHVVHLWQPSFHTILRSEISMAMTPIDRPVSTQDIARSCRSQLCREKYGPKRQPNTS